MKSLIGLAQLIILTTTCMVLNNNSSYYYKSHGNFLLNYIFLYKINVGRKLGRLIPTSCHTNMVMKTTQV